MQKMISNVAIILIISCAINYYGYHVVAALFVGCPDNLLYLRFTHCPATTRAGSPDVAVAGAVATHVSPEVIAPPKQTVRGWPSCVGAGNVIATVVAAGVAIYSSITPAEIVTADAELVVLTALVPDVSAMAPAVVSDGTAETPPEL